MLTKLSYLVEYTKNFCIFCCILVFYIFLLENRNILMFFFTLKSTFLSMFLNIRFSPKRRQTPDLLQLKFRSATRMHAFLPKGHKKCQIEAIKTWIHGI